MRVGILTFHYVDNYGAVLQAYSLLSYLKKNGIDAEVINYNNTALRNKVRSKSSLVKSKIWALVHHIIAGEKKHNNFEAFRKNRLLLNEQILSTNETMRNYLLDENINTVIVGSDQVWNPLITGYDETYLLYFYGFRPNRISYAASFGKSSIENRWLNAVIDQIKEFEFVSVREETAKSILVKGGFEKPIHVLPDPVFLTTAEDWIRIATLPLNMKDYVLCYIMPGDKKIERKIENIAKELSIKHNARIIYLGRKEYKRFNNDGRDMIYASPEDFLGYFINAKIILTNSFHGTAFSIVFQKDFYSFVNTKLSNEVQLGSRISDLLRLLNLSERCISDYFNELAPIDYEEPDRIINEMTAQAKKQLMLYLKDNKTGGY